MVIFICGIVPTYLKVLYSMGEQGEEVSLLRFRIVHLISIYHIYGMYQAVGLHWSVHTLSLSHSLLVSQGNEKKANVFPINYTNTTLPPY